MTHEERAARWFNPHCECREKFCSHVLSLAEQFREVEREAQREWITQNAPGGWIDALRAQLREVVRAGDALRESVRISYQSAFPQSHAAPPVVAAWDAATKGIQRG